MTQDLTPGAQLGIPQPRSPIVFQTRGIDPEPVRAAAPALPRLRNRNGAGPAALAVAAVLAVNALPRLLPALDRRVDASERVSGVLGTAASACARVASPLGLPQADLLLPGWAATLALLTALAVGAALVVEPRVGQGGWAVLRLVLALLLVLPAQGLLTAVGTDDATTVTAVLVALTGLLLLTGMPSWRVPGSGTSGTTGLGALLGCLLFLSAPLAVANAQLAPVADSAVPRATASASTVRAADGKEVRALRGKWVAQLASVQVARGAGPSAAYMSEHAQAASAHGALLLRGDDIWSPALDDRHWITVGNRAFPSGRAALAWCEQQALDADHCFARRLVTGPADRVTMKP